MKSFFIGHGEVVSVMGMPLKINNRTGFLLTGEQYMKVQSLTDKETKKFVKIVDDFRMFFLELGYELVEEESHTELIKRIIADYNEMVK